MEILYLLLSYALLGLFAGAMAGLLGVGGGLIIVPLLAGLFAGQGFAEQHLMQLAVGTSLATIVFTSLSSTWAHHRRGAVNWAVMRQLSMGIVTGAWLGGVLAVWLGGLLLAGLFGLFELLVAAQMAFGKPPAAHRTHPGRLRNLVSGALIGAVSTLLGIGGGTLTVTTTNVTLDSPLRDYDHVNSGEYVRLDISDTGPGIDPDVIKKIFDPFFSTKKMDRIRGSGLGLSVVHNIINDHDGYIQVDSENGNGTTFSIYLPASSEEDLSVVIASTIGGRERVLVVDDDPIQGQVMSRLLARLGYNASVCSSGEEAVDFVITNPQDLVILDMIMDGIDGTETYRKMLEAYPAQKAIVLSGYAMSERVEEALRLGAGAFVTKPTNLNTLANTVRQVLDRAEH